MNDQEFKQIRKKFNEMGTKELDDRGPSYAEKFDGNEDRLANFKVLAKDIGISPMQVLMIYLKKHMRSIERYVRDGHQTSEGVITNFVGARNYLDLAVALDQDLSRSKIQSTQCLHCGHDNPHKWAQINCPKCSPDILCETSECYCQNYETN